MRENCTAWKSRILPYATQNKNRNQNIFLHRADNQCLPDVRAHVPDSYPTRTSHSRSPIDKAGQLENRSELCYNQFQI